MKHMVWPYSNASRVMLADILAHHFNKPLFDFWFSIKPLVDQLLLLDKFTPSHQEQKRLKKQRVWQLPLITTMLVEWFHFFYCLNKVSFGKVDLVTFMLIVIGSSGMGAKGFLVAHEVLSQAKLS
jgi:hypothetical protein